MTACICRRHAVRMDCPVHGSDEYVADFRRIVQPKDSVLDDPIAKAADHADWDRRKNLMDGTS